MFRITVKTQMVAGELHYHVTGYRANGGRAFAVAELHESEWLAFYQSVEHDHRFQIEVFDGAIQATPADAAASE